VRERIVAEVERSIAGNETLDEIDETAAEHPAARP
jgi:hypothetical protein